MDSLAGNRPPDVIVPDSINVLAPEEQIDRMGFTPHILVVGGGVLGTAIARDLAIRGLEVTVVEQGRLTAGTSGRTQGVLYSGARFATNDPAGAVRCRSERRVLEEIADHCIRETGGYIVPTAASEEQFDEHLDALEDCNIPYETVDRNTLAEHGVNDSLDRAISVPDAVVDPFQLTLANAAGAEQFGATLVTGATVTDLQLEDGRVVGATIEHGAEPGSEIPPPERTLDATARSGEDQTETATPAIEGDAEKENDKSIKAEEGADTTRQGDRTAQSDEGKDGQGDETAHSEDDAAEDGAEMPGTVQRQFPGVSDSDGAETGEIEEIDADYVINASGAWADRIAALAGIDLPLSQTRESVLVVEHSPPAVLTKFDADGPSLALAPFWGNGVLGPIRKSGDDPGRSITASIDSALDEVATVLPAIEASAVYRSYSGVWTQHGSSDSDPGGPGAAVIDHYKYDDVWGLLTTIGAPVTTHRLIAERAVDRVCDEFGIERDCKTKEIDLPDPGFKTATNETNDELAETAKSASDSLTDTIMGGSSKANPVLCESKSVRERDVQRIFDEEGVSETDLEELRIRTGATMGACQGGRCGHRLASVLYPKQESETIDEALEELLAKRWRGRRRTLWGAQLGAALEDYEYHANFLNRGREAADTIDVSRFDGGVEPAERQPPRMCEAMKR